MVVSSSVPTSEPSGVSMDVLSVLRLIVRHWRVTVPAALLTLLGLVAALKLSPPTYHATGSIALLSPPEAPDVEAPPESTPEVGQNPFARYGDLSIMGDILARIMNSDSKHHELESQGVSDYDVVANAFQQRGPLLEVTGQASNPDGATRSTEIVLAEVNTVLTELQRVEGADPQYFITGVPLEAPSAPTAMYGSAMRAAIGALAVGALSTLGLAVLAEAVARRRTIRHVATPGDVMSDSASSHTDGGASNGSPKAGWSGIAWPKASQEEPSNQEPAWPKESQEEPSKRKSAWQESFQQEPFSEAPADNGHRQPTSDRNS